MTRPLPAACLALTLGVTLSSGAAMAGMPAVTPTGNDSFAVAPAGGLSASEAFCAAGTYAAEALGMETSARIWRITPVPRKAGQPMVFSTSPEGAAAHAGLILFGRDDGSVSVGFARALCDGLWRID